MAASLRCYWPEDFETLFEIDQACYPPEIAYSRRELRYFLRQKGAGCTIAEADGAIAGFILFHGELIQGHIITLDVIETCRRTGIGSQLLAAAEKNLAERGIECICLETATNNEPAIAFWHKHGYRSYGRLKDYYSGITDAWLMHKHFGRTREIDPT